jgi:hypothetical protein
MKLDSDDLVWLLLGAGFDAMVAATHFFWGTPLPIVYVVP